MASHAGGKDSYYFHPLKSLSQKPFVLLTENKMYPQNLAVVFGPTLMRSPDSDIAHMGQQCSVIEAIIRHCDSFFPDDEKVEAMA